MVDDESALGRLLESSTFAVLGGEFVALSVLVAAFDGSLLSGWLVLLPASVVASASAYFGYSKTKPAIPVVLHPLLVLYVPFRLGNLSGGIGIDNTYIFGVNPAIAIPWLVAGVLVTLGPYLLAYALSVVLPRVRTASTRA